MENSTQWEGRWMRREETTSVRAVYSVQARSDGEINNFVLKAPR